MFWHDCRRCLIFFNTSVLSSVFNVYIMNVCFGLLQLSRINSYIVHCSFDFVERSTSSRGQNNPYITMINANISFY